MPVVKKQTKKSTREALDEIEFWNNKLDALYIALRNGWNFSWPADPPQWWTDKANEMREKNGI